MWKKHWNSYVHFKSKTLRKHQKFVENSSMSWKQHWKTKHTSILTFFNAFQHQKFDVEIACWIAYISDCFEIWKPQHNFWVTNLLYSKIPKDLDILRHSIQPGCWSRHQSNIGNIDCYFTRCCQSCNCFRMAHILEGDIVDFENPFTNFQALKK